MGCFLRKQKIIFKYQVCVVLIFLFSCYSFFITIHVQPQDLRFSMRHFNPTAYIGPGENGSGISIPEKYLTSEVATKIEDSYKSHGFNEYISDMISVHRTLPDTIPDKECQEKIYSPFLPHASIIIPFRNEAWSTLLRTFHSVLDRTPSSFITEVLLVDDGSDADYLKSKLDIYVNRIASVRVIRIQHSVGLSTARQIGIDQAKADVIVVMDSHFEVGNGWYEPLAERIQQDPSLLVVPVVDTIDHETFRYYPSVLRLDKADTPTFDFYLGQTRSLLKQEYLDTLSSLYQPISIPAIQGGFFMANKTTFLRLGGFDKGMGVWGGEQMELSFKYWSCGGRIELITCSRVGHVYRTRVVWHQQLAQKNVSNEYRVAEVWMDDYKHHVFQMNGNYTHEIGDVTERHAIRKRNKCKSFQFYLDTIRQFVLLYVPDDLKAAGVIMSKSTALCLDGSTKSYSREPVIVFSCHFTGGPQYWELSHDGEIRHGMNCITTAESGGVVSTPCSQTKSQLYRWTYTEEYELVEEKSNKCLTAIEPYKQVLVSKCNGDVRQKWSWKRK